MRIAKAILAHITTKPAVDLSELQKYDLHESETVSDGVKAHSAWVGPTAVGRFVRLDDVQGSIEANDAELLNEVTTAYKTLCGIALVSPQWVSVETLDRMLALIVKATGGTK